jgi:hypothetical protein
MKITISLPQEVFNKLEGIRHLVPRSTYIRGLILDEYEERSRAVLESGFNSKVSYDDSKPISSFHNYGEIKLDPEDTYELKERVVVKHKEKSLEGLVKTGAVKKGVKVTGTKGTKSKKLPEQDMGSFKTYFK